VLEELRTKRGGTGHLGVCPRKSFHHDDGSKSLVSLYAQVSKAATNATKLELVGVFCRDCPYVRLDKPG
jgi:hypothetical protein